MPINYTSYDNPFDATTFDVTAIISNGINETTQFVCPTTGDSGIGKQVSILLATQELKFIATARKVNKLTDLQDYRWLTFPMDVTREESIRQAFALIHARTNHVDILVNNAGYCQNGFIEELILPQLEYQFAVNVFGTVRVSQMVLPAMRRQNSGHIINIGSVGGDFTSPGAGAYHASKYALESITDAMRQEPAGFKIHVPLIKPAGVETSFGDSSQFPAPMEGNPYEKMRLTFIGMTTPILKADR